MFWVSSLAEKEALVADPESPWFTTAHFEGHHSVLIRAGRVRELSYGELTEMVQEAWLSRASTARARAWCATPGSA